MLGIGQHNAGGNKTTTQISQDSFSNNGLKPSLWGVKTKQKANVPPCVMETARALVCRQWHLESIFPYFLALLPCILFSSQEDLSIMVARWLAAKSRLTLCWHSHPTAVLATVSGARFIAPRWVLCPSLPGAVSIPVQNHMD